MKKHFKFSNFVAVIFSVLIAAACTPASVKLAPTVTTTVISSITANGAVSGGVVSSDGGAAITAKGVCWSTSPSPTTANSKTVSATITSPFTCTMTGLIASTTYYLRAFATNSEGTSYGNEISFSTTQATLPIITTSAVSAIGATSVTGGGDVSSDGGATVTARGVCWSTTAAPTIALTSKVGAGTGAGTFVSSITGLNASTTYFARAYATNSLGTVYGNEVQFTTTAVPANTPGTLTVSTTTSTAGGSYKPNNVVAIWIKTSSNTFVKSLLVYANARKYDLSNWYSNSGQNTVNATTGATQSSYATRTCTWNGTNASGTVVANGDYKVCMELSDGMLSYKEVTFTKGPSAANLTPAGSGSFSTVSINWTPN